MLDSRLTSCDLGLVCVDVGEIRNGSLGLDLRFCWRGFCFDLRGFYRSCRTLSNRMSIAMCSEKMSRSLGEGRSKSPDSSMTC